MAVNYWICIFYHFWKNFKFSKINIYGRVFVNIGQPNICIILDACSYIIIQTFLQFSTYDAHCLSNIFTILDACLYMDRL